MEKEKLKIAIVGFGKMGVLHAGILNVLPGVKLAAICEKSGLIRRFLKRVFRDVDVVDCVEKLSRLDLDAVYVTTPIVSHFPVVKSLYESGIARNLFVEKTLASNFDEARELCELARKFGGVNMVGYMRRFSVTFKKAKDLLDEGVIGKPVSFRAYAYSSDFFGLERNSKAQTPKVGVVRDLGCHALDLALWFFGDFRVEDAKIESVVNDGSMDSAYFRVKAPSGVVGDFSGSWCVDGYRMPEVGFLIEGSEGSLSVNDDELAISLKDGRKQKWFRH
ncbi:MAG: Gfo/Idh/MocA family oxidoreductase, partial [Candidatus Bathyarchaeia archaeon]